MKVVQEAIGRVVREECDATQPLPDRLADLIRKLNLRMDGWSVSKPDEYRTNGQECERMAGNSRDPDEKAAGKAEAYLRRAEGCERQANEAKDLEAKRMFKEAAEQWRLMASTAERQGWYSLGRDNGSLGT